MGISQSTHGTDNARCLIALATITGHVGRPGTGLHPLRGQNNVQGASDVGLIPMVFPDYQAVDAPDIRARFEDAWGTSLDPERGLTVVEIMHAILDGEIKGMYIMGENPAMSDPDMQHAREALAKLEHLVVQDLFLTETAFHADVILPASAWPEKDGTVTNTNRQVQLGRQRATAPRRGAPGLVDRAGNRAPARARLALRAPAGRLRGDDGSDAVARQHHLGAARARERGDVSVPRSGAAGGGHRLRRRIPDRERAGEARAGAHRARGRGAGRRVPHGADDGPAARALAHGGDHPAGRRSSMRSSRRRWRASRPRTSAGWGSRQGRSDPHLDPARVAIEIATRRDPAVPEGMVFVPFCFAEAAANVLTNPELDPFGKIPGFKLCAASESSRRRRRRTIAAAD